MNFRSLIFCAVDYTDIEESKKLISKIENFVGGIKIGLEFFPPKNSKIPLNRAYLRSQVAILQIGHQ